jgi:Ca2+-binding RTX toxin-like protein
MRLPDELHGGAGNDALSGGNGHNWLFGDRGDDYLDNGPGFRGASGEMEGGPGNDQLTALLHNPWDAAGYSWQELTGGRGADTFRIDATAHNGTVDWANIYDFDQAQGDRFGIEVGQTDYSDWLTDSDPAQTFAALDTDANGRLDDADQSVAYDGRALWVQAGGDNVLFWDVDHLDFAWLAA